MGSIVKLGADFKKLMSARFFFSFAVQMQAVIVGWRIYDLKHDPLALGLIGLTEALPAIGLAMYAGYFVDGGRPLSIYRGVLGVSLVSALVVFFAQVLSGQLGTDSQTFLLYVASFLTGTARAFSQPSMYAVVPRMVPKELIPQSSAWMSSSIQMSRIMGPALGGIVYGLYGMTVSAFCVAVVLCVAILCALFTQLEDNKPARVQRGIPTRADFFSGAGFVLRHPILFPALTLDMISVLFGGVVALLPIFADTILHVGPRGLGALRAAPAVGAVLVSLMLSKRDFGARAGKLLLSAVGGFGLCVLVFGLSHNFYLSLGVLALSGFFDGFSMIIRGAAVQIASPADMRGRISAVNSIFIGSSNEIGEFESGIAAKALGLVPSVIFGGCICLLTVACIGFFSKSLREMDLNKI